MPQNKELNTEEWFKRANEDESAAKILLREKLPSISCFHSQQVAEKYLKAFLVANKKWFPKIHELDRLLELCIKIDSSFIELKENAVFLNDYYFDVRYPGDMPEFTLEEAEQAFEMALHVKEFVLKKLNITEQ